MTTPKMLLLIVCSLPWLLAGCKADEEPCECEDPTPCDDDVADDDAADDDSATDDDDTTAGDDDDATGLTEEQFVEAYIAGYCERALECFDAVTLEALGWATVDDCIESFEDPGDDDDSAGDDDDSAGDDDDSTPTEDCVYTGEATHLCLQAIASASCEDFIAQTWLEDCEAVWDCS